jgi:class 3 adenylate cyclase
MFAINPAGPIDWGDLAGGAGYFDQARFGHESRAFTGLTPTRYVEVRRRFLREHPGHALDVDTGPVVGGVIGRNRFIYDVWGDTVNTASRMELHGVPDRIQVTSRVVDSLGDSYTFEPRGPIDVKGKGRMEVWPARRSRMTSSHVERHGTE